MSEVVSPHLIFTSYVCRSCTLIWKHQYFTFYQNRMTSCSGTSHAFDTHFLRLLFATSPRQWVEKYEDTGINIFDKNVLFFPFHASGHKSLFVVLGAHNIRNYTQRGFKGSRPCILHFDPHEFVRGRHDHNAVADKLRTCLNSLWRWEHSENDHMIMPFNKRTLPNVRPYGTLIILFHLLSKCPRSYFKFISTPRKKQC